jgi:hypothetical protein
MSKYSHTKTFPLRALAVVLLASLILLAACGADLDSSAQVTPNTENTTTTDGVVNPAPSYGVSFQYDPSLAAGVQSQLVNAFTEDTGMDQLLVPQHLAYTFADSYTDDEPLLQRPQLNLTTMPQIVVYPAADYAATQPMAQDQIDQLKDLLTAKPSAPDGPMPYLPLNNAAQVFNSQVAYLEFENGSGVRYVTAFSQDASPTTNEHLLYTFQGLTDDGDYYVAAFFPVTTADLPDTAQVDDWDAFNINYPTYVAETEAMINDLSPLDFTPNLTLLDDVVTSLQVEPDVDLNGLE